MKKLLMATVATIALTRQVALGRGADRPRRWRESRR